VDNLIKLVKTYRLTTGLAERTQLAEAIFRIIEPKLRLFVFSAVRPQSAEDVLQEVLKAIVKSLKNFRGETEEDFLRWCRGVARHKIHDQYHAYENERLQPLPPEEILEMVDESAQATALTAADRHDLEYAMNLLTQSKPECRDYLWNHYVIGFDYAEIAEEQKLNYDNVRMKIGRCLETAKSLVA
jgi:RNA polymerase sigma factor (sigma-70 family)